jgi:hypothetical protein
MPGNLNEMVHSLNRLQFLLLSMQPSYFVQNSSQLQYINCCSHDKLTCRNVFTVQLLKESRENLCGGGGWTGGFSPHQIRQVQARLMTQRNATSVHTLTHLLAYSRASVQYIYHGMCICKHFSENTVIEIQTVQLTYLHAKNQFL